MREIADELRLRATALRDADVVEPNRELPGVLLAEIPNGVGHVLRAIWQTPDGSAPSLSIGVWRETGRGQVSPIASRCLTIAYFRLPALAEALAEALELAKENVIEFKRARALRSEGPSGNARGGRVR
jgi:hypothetical protein